jgi:predicted transcriptional regulator
MKQITIKLRDDLDAKLRHEAARRGMTIAAIVREALDAHLVVGKRRHLLAAKSGRSGYHDTARRIEELLRDGFGR